MIEQAMSITPIVFVLIILLFGFDSTEQVKTARQTQSGLRRSSGAEGSRKKSLISETSIFETLKKQVTNQIKTA